MADVTITVNKSDKIKLVKEAGDKFSIEVGNNTLAEQLDKESTLVLQGSGHLADITIEKGNFIPRIKFNTDSRMSVDGDFIAAKSDKGQTALVYSNPVFMTSMVGVDVDIPKPNKEEPKRPPERNPRKPSRDQLPAPREKEPKKPPVQLNIQYNLSTPETKLRLNENKPGIDKRFPTGFVEFTYKNASGSVRNVMVEEGARVDFVDGGGKQQFTLNGSETLDIMQQRYAVARAKAMEQVETVLSAKLDSDGKIIEKNLAIGEEAKELLGIPKKQIKGMVNIIAVRTPISDRTLEAYLPFPAAASVPKERAVPKPEPEKPEVPSGPPRPLPELKETPGSAQKEAMQNAVNSLVSLKLSNASFMNEHKKFSEKLDVILKSSNGVFKDGEINRDGLKEFHNALQEAIDDAQRIADTAARPQNRGENGNAGKVKKALVEIQENVKTKISLMPSLDGITLAGIVLPDAQTDNRSVDTIRQTALAMGIGGGTKTKESIVPVVPLAADKKNHELG